MLLGAAVQQNEVVSSGSDCKVRDIKSVYLHSLSVIYATARGLHIYWPNEITHHLNQINQTMGMIF